MAESSETKTPESIPETTQPESHQEDRPSHQEHRREHFQGRRKATTPTAPVGPQPFEGECLSCGRVEVKAALYDNGQTLSGKCPTCRTRIIVKSPSKTDEEGR